jgi:hypothetical protein
MKKMFDLIVQNREELIYDLIFSENSDYKINLSNYVDDIYQYEDFVEEIRVILKKSKVKVIKTKILVDSKTAIWNLKVSK